MSTANNYLLVLSESLDKKIIILKELEVLTAEQKSIMDSEELDEEAFNDNVNKKATLIEELEKLDNGFQILYDNIKQQLEGNREQYAEQIRELQGKIKLIMDHSSSLQAAEQRNNTLIRNRFNSIRKEVYQVRKNREAASNYYKNMNKVNDSSSYFMDKKK